MRISDWSSDVCSSDLVYRLSPPTARLPVLARPLVVNRVLILAGAFVLRLSVWLPFQGYQPGLWLLLPVTLRPAAASDLCAEAILHAGAVRSADRQDRSMSNHSAVGRMFPFLKSLVVKERFQYRGARLGVNYSSAIFYMQ